MRFRPLLLLLLPLLLAACAKTNAPVRLDFIGTAGLTSGSRAVGPSDTLTTRAYAVGADNPLVRMRVTVQYEPTRVPIVYPLPLSSYDPTKALNDEELTYLDSLIVPVITGQYRGGEFVLLNKFNARSTSGTELWRYTVTDSQGESASRAYRLTARKPDSAAVFHGYAVQLRPVPAGTPAAPGPRGVRARDSLRDQSRVYLSLRSGLQLPRFSLLNNQNSLQANQPLIDLVCLSNGSSVSLAAPAAGALALPPARWPAGNRRRTRLLLTGLTEANFNDAKTTDAFTDAFRAGQLLAPDSLSAGPLAKGRVLAFRTSDNYTGLLLVADLTTGTAPVLSCRIKVQK